jgi:TetR/AcrR family tetracycline transcriptional repressor
MDSGSRPRGSVGRLLPDRRGVVEETLVRAALDVLDETGLDGLSLRLIGERVGVRGPALYWYFRNKQALLDQMAEVMLADQAAGLARPAEGEPWWEWLEGIARWLRRALLSRRDGARVFAGTSVPAERTFLRMLDLVVAVLRTAGFPAADALRAATTVHVYVVGSTIVEQARPGAEGSEGAEERFPGDAEYPALAAALAGFELEPDRTFEQGLGLILAGLRDWESRLDALERHLDAMPETDE